MRVLIVVHGVPPGFDGDTAPMAAGGTELYALAHARAMANRPETEVLLVAREADPRRSDYSLRSVTRDGVNVVLVNNTFRSVRAFAATYANPQVDAVARRVIDDFAPDIAHVHHLTGLSTGIVDHLANCRVPVVMTVHDYWLICHRGQLLNVHGRICDGPEPPGCHACLGLAAGSGSAAFAGASVVRALEQRLPSSGARVVRMAAEGVGRLVASSSAGDEAERQRFEHMKSLCRRIDHFIAPSSAIRDRFVQFGVERARITVSGYGVDPAPFSAVQRASSRTLRIGFLGSVMLSKGVHVLLEAFSALRPGAATLDIFGEIRDYHGDASYRDRLTPFLRAGVKMHGAVAHADVPHALAAIDVLAVPSIWPENSPFVIREAFLAGVPVIASNLGGIPELVTDGKSGLLVRAGDPVDLSTALMRLVDEPGLLASLKAGVPPVRTLTDDVEQTVRLLEARSRVRLERATATDRHTAAVVLNYRAAEQTLLAVRSLLRSNRRLSQLLVVDNDPSSDCSDLLGGLRHAAVTYLRAGRNLGFSGGVNLGVGAALEAGADRVLLVNSDAVVPPDCLTLLEAALDRQSDGGIAGPLLVDRARPDILLSSGLEFAPRTGRVRVTGSGNPVEKGATEAVQVDAISGCVMLIDRRVFERVGFFDEAYFFSFEDLDFCLRARAAGVPTVLVPSAVAYHEGSRSIGAGSAHRLYFAARNHLRLVRQVAPAGRLASLGRDASIVALNLAHAAVRARGGTVASRLGAVIRGTRDHAAGRFGAGA